MSIYSDLCVLDSNVLCNNNSLILRLISYCKSYKKTTVKIDSLDKSDEKV